MKSTGNIDVFELLGPPDGEAFEAVRQERKPVSRVITHFSNWFKQVVLLS